MDKSDAEKIILTKYGFNLNLIGFSTFLSIFGIVVSVLEVLGTIADMVVLTLYPRHDDVDPRLLDIAYSIGGGMIVLYILSLGLWSLLKIKTGRRDVTSIENIAKIYCYVIGVLEIILMIGLIIMTLFLIKESDPVTLLIAVVISLFTWTVYLIIACLKIHGIRTQNNMLLGIYIGYRYAIFVIISILLLIASILTWEVHWIYLIDWVVFSILDIGLVVILHSIRVVRANKSTEAAM